MEVEAEPEAGESQETVLVLLDSSDDKEEEEEEDQEEETGTQEVRKERSNNRNETTSDVLTFDLSRRVVFSLLPLKRQPSTQQRFLKKQPMI